MSTEAQNLSHEMILPAYKAADIYVPIRHTSTTVEGPLQISSFLTNKANLLNAQMNVSSFLTRDYENKSNWTLGENKPNQSQYKANQSQLKPIKCQNKPNTNPISNATLLK